MGVGRVSNIGMRVDVVVDDREPRDLVKTVSAQDDVATVDVRRLDAGDIVVGDVGIERKTLADYTSSLIGRGGPDLYDQIRRLSDAFTHSYVLLEDQLPADGDEHVPAVAIRGSVASITARLGTPVIPCSDRERLVDLAIRLGRKHLETPSTPALPQSSVTTIGTPTTKQMYGCIDGIGPDTADRLYQAFPAVADVLAASRTELMEVEGIGAKRADAIYTAFRTPE